MNKNHKQKSDSSKTRWINYWWFVSSSIREYFKRGVQRLGFVLILKPLPVFLFFGFFGAKDNKIAINIIRLYSLTLTLYQIVQNTCDLTSFYLSWLQAQLNSLGVRLPMIYIWTWESVPTACYSKPACASDKPNQHTSTIFERLV